MCCTPSFLGAGYDTQPSKNLPSPRSTAQEMYPLTSLMVLPMIDASDRFSRLLPPSSSSPRSQFFFLAFVLGLVASHFSLSVFSSSHPRTLRTSSPPPLLRASSHYDFQLARPLITSGTTIIPASTTGRNGLDQWNLRRFCRTRTVGVQEGRRHCRNEDSEFEQGVRNEDGLVERPGLGTGGGGKPQRI